MLPRLKGVARLYAPPSLTGFLEVRTQLLENHVSDIHAFAGKNDPIGDDQIVLLRLGERLNHLRDLLLEFAELLAATQIEILTEFVLGTPQLSLRGPDVGLLALPLDL